MSALPLTPAEHEHSAAVDLAAQWLVAQGDTTGMAVIPELRQRFGITAAEACAACRQAGLIRRAS